MFKRKNGTWQHQVSYLHKGKKKYKYFYGKSESEILRKVAKWRGEEEAGPTFEDAADAWERDCMGNYAPGTQAMYRTALSRARAEFDTYRLKQILPVMIKNFVDKLADEKKWAHNTTKVQISVFSLVYKHASYDDPALPNPAAQVRPKRGLRKGRRELPLESYLDIIKSTVFDEPMAAMAYTMPTPAHDPGKQKPFNIATLKVMRFISPKR